MDDSMRSVMEDEGQVPDLKYITDNLIKILACMEENEMVQLRKMDNELFKRKMEDKFNEFSERYYSMFQQLLTGETDNIGKIIMMLDALHRVNRGQLTMDGAFEDVRETLSKEYIYPKFGGKQSFEKKIIERANKKK